MRECEENKRVDTGICYESTDPNRLVGTVVGKALVCRCFSHLSQLKLKPGQATGLLCFSKRNLLFLRITIRPLILIRLLAAHLLQLLQQLLWRLRPLLVLLFLLLHLPWLARLPVRRLRRQSYLG